MSWIEVLSHRLLWWESKAAPSIAWIVVFEVEEDSADELDFTSPFTILRLFHCSLKKLQSARKLHEYECLQYCTPSRWRGFESCSFLSQSSKLAKRDFEI